MKHLNDIVEKQKDPLGHYTTPCREFPKAVEKARFERKSLVNNIALGLATAALTGLMYYAMSFNKKPDYQLQRIVRPINNGYEISYQLKQK